MRFRLVKVDHTKVADLTIRRQMQVVGVVRYAPSTATPVNCTGSVLVDP